MTPPTPSGLIAVTDPALPSPEHWLEAAEACLRAGAPWLMLRARALSHADYLRAATHLRAVATATGARLLVHTHADIAAQIGADGLHLPSNAPDARVVRSRIGPRADRWTITRACHTLDDLTRAHHQRCQAALYSPIFAPTSKPADTRPHIGLDGLRAACAHAAPLPLIALGGITPARARACRASGAAGVAVIGALFGDTLDAVPGATQALVQASPPHA